MCNNDKDFVTMEQLIEIPYEYFFSYTDKQNFTYGFNITSLIQVYKTKGCLMNPYNREKFSKELLDQVISLYRITWLIYSDFKQENEYLSLFQLNVNQTRIRPTYQHYVAPQQQTSSILTNNYRPSVNRGSLILPEDIHRYNHICEIRLRSVHQRITDMFIEFDQLGNYTNSDWFTTLQTRDYVRLYRIIYDIWNFRNLNREIRSRICPFHEPFDGIFPRPMQNHEITQEQIKIACLIVFENLIYSGADEETRKLGAFHALSGLTIVSPGARAAMPWLYESIAY
jgi:hypothetical protein